MKLENKTVYEFLKKQGITHLYHSNSVSTSITFLEQGGLLSRGDIEKLQLHQTWQKSDFEDQKLDVWDDVFLDTVDLHKHFRRQNYYGPALFQFKLEACLDRNINIWITKDNPTRWSEIDPSEHYMQGSAELTTLWHTLKRERIMFTIKKPKTPIFFNHLERVTLDNPSTFLGNTSLFTEAKNALQSALTYNNFDSIQLIERNCEDCYCTSNYKNQVKANDLAKLFLPKDHPRFRKK